MKGNPFTSTRLLRLTVGFALATAPVTLPVHAQTLQSNGPNAYRCEQLTTDHGLSVNRINSIYRDDAGFTWMGTSDGLNRFDGRSFRIYNKKAGDTTSLLANTITSLASGPGKTIWIKHPGNAFTIYHQQTERFSPLSDAMLRKFGLSHDPLLAIHKSTSGKYVFLQPYRLTIYDETSGRNITYTHQPDSSTINPANMTGMSLGPDGSVWLMHSTGVLEKFDLRQRKIIYRTPHLVGALGSIGVDFRCFTDREELIWVYTPFDPNGAYCFIPTSKNWKHFRKGEGLNENTVNTITQDPLGCIWLGTVNGGVNVIDKRSWTTSFVMAGGDHTKQTTVNSLLSDQQGIIWVGTLKQGVRFFHRPAVNFPVTQYRLDATNPAITSDVHAVAEDRNGNFWIGTNGNGLLHLNPTTGAVKQFVRKPGDKTGISNDKVYSICIDRNERLWVSTFWGGVNYSDGDRFFTLRHQDDDPGSLSDDRVSHILQTQTGEVWFATAKGIDRYDRSTNRFVHYPLVGTTENTQQAHHLAEGHDGTLWAATREGLFQLPPHTRRFVRFTPASGVTFSLDSRISLVQTSSNGLVWAATDDGLVIIDPATRRIELVNRSSGLSSNVIFAIHEDRRGSIWVSTLNNVARVEVNKSSIANVRVTNYDKRSGLPGNEFNEGAGLVTRSGKVLIGSGSTLVEFDPAAIRDQAIAYPPILTDLFVLNKRVETGAATEGPVALTRPLNATRTLELAHDQNILALEFATLNFLNAGRQRYSYKLEGFDKEWVEPDFLNRRATYTNLDPGVYTFRLRNTDSRGNWNPEEKTLRIVVSPPLWKTMPAYSVYVLAVCGALLLIRRNGIRRIRRRFEAEAERLEARRRIEEERKIAQQLVEQEREKAQQERELDLAKIKFFTNVSHEFKTPISLVLSPVEKLLRENDRPEMAGQLQVIRRNSRRLLNMVNQLLDFRKMGEQELRLQAIHGDIVSFVRECALSFSDIAEKKQITLLFESEPEHCYLSFDPEKMERVLFNLLSNAFKFTPEGGNVSVFVSFDHPQQATSLEIRVNDSGIGISKAGLKRIFEPFFQEQLPTSMLNQGTGIGLSIVREFVHLHQGEVTVESQPGKGTFFRVTLPVVVKQKSKLREKISEPARESTARQLPKKTDLKRAIVLIVEDNDELRHYLRETLAPEYTVIEASNGKAGWQQALSRHPDLVISDINMPEMSGTELCAKIKQDKRTSHLPVILLTAYAAEEQQLEGLQTGANDYLVKPVNVEILLSKARNLIALKELLEKAYKKQVDIQLPEVKIQSEDERFMNRLFTYIEANMTKTTLSVEEISSHMCMSRVSLYKKVLAVTGKSPVELVNSIKMKKAIQLIEGSQMKVSEIAYAVGFNSPKYFCRVFKATFQRIPSDYVAEIRGTKDNSLLMEELQEPELMET